MDPIYISPSSVISGHDPLSDSKEYLSKPGDVPGPSLFDDFQWDIVNDNILDAVWPFWRQEELQIITDKERTKGCSCNQTETSHSIATDATISAQLESMFFSGDFSGSIPVSPISFETGNFQEKANDGMEFIDQCAPKEIAGEQGLFDAQSPPFFSYSPGVPNQESYFDDFDGPSARSQSPALVWESTLNSANTGHRNCSRKSKIRSFASATSVYTQQRLSINSALAQNDSIHSESNGGLIHVYNTRKRKYQTNFNDESDESEDGRSQQATNGVRGSIKPDDVYHTCELLRIKSCPHAPNDLPSHQSQSDCDVLNSLHAMWSSITDPVGKVGRQRTIHASPFLIRCMYHVYLSLVHAQTRPHPLSSRAAKSSSVITSCTEEASPELWAPFEQGIRDKR